MSKVKLFHWLAFFCLCLFLGVLVSQRVNLVTADLGRHLKNGELVFKNPQVLKINFYSYTNNDFAFLNHHWGSGVIFFLIKKAFGFSGLSVFFTLVTLATFGLFFDIARRASRFFCAFLAAVLVMPLLAFRIEIRPEVFSYFFCGVFFWVLWQVKNKKISSRWLWLLPALELVWINLHIYFFLGFFILGVFFLESFLDKSSKKYLLSLIKVASLSTVAVLINPAGIRGVVYPLKIYGNFGYRLLENQSVWFLDKIIDYPQNAYFKIVFGALVLSWILILVKRKKPSFYGLVFSIFFSVIAWLSVRNFTLFGFFALPIFCVNLSTFIGRSAVGGEETTEAFLFSSLALLLAVGLFLVNPQYWAVRKSFGFGLQEGNQAAAEFFLENNLPGPVFNNYDNGGYLIYFLYPKQKVFVDNRPEAYPTDFFQRTYIPMQENNQVWKQMEEKYDFKTIFFYRHDLTPWAQAFLINRVKDPAWAVIYVDNWSIILVERNEENMGIIEKYGLPRGRFLIR